MKPRRTLWLVPLLLSLAATLNADSGKLTETQRRDILRAFVAENPYIHRTFPQGKTGLRVEDGRVTPSEDEVRQLAAQSGGVAAKPGERARITEVKFVRHGVILEINGGPVKRKKWYDRLSVGMGGMEATPTGQVPSDADVMTNAHGSYVLLVFKGDVPSLTVDQIKAMLEPVLDFKSMSMAEAYQKSLPPKLAEAVKDHRALVGMDREMVTFAKGRPTKRVRESEEGKDYEEWIYGAPPEEVEFIRFTGDKVVRIEQMKVDGEKLVRTNDEVGDLSGVLAANKRTTEQQGSEGDPGDKDRSAPSLMRPGEKPLDTMDGTRDPNPHPVTPNGTGAPPSNGPQ